MSSQFDLCFSTQSRATLPLDTNNSGALRQFRKDNPHIIGNFIPTGTPFVLSEPNSDAIKSLRQSRPDISCALDTVMSWPQSTKRNVATMANDFGDETLLAIAGLYEQEIKPYLDHTREVMQNKVDSYTAVGAAATAMNERQLRLSNFGQAIFKYQSSLEEIRNASKNKAPKQELIKLGQRAKNAHAILNEQFTRELKTFAGRVKSGGRGNIWSNPKRGINIATSARSSAPLQLTSLSGIRNLRALEIGSDILGKGIIVLDGAVRLGNVYDDYKGGNDWQRRAIVETAGFGFGTAAGAAVGGTIVKAGVGIAIAAGPAGWVILIGVGLGAGYFAAKAGDSFGQNIAATLYDKSSSIDWF